MADSMSGLTVFYEAPFWVGVLERESDGRCEACKITFGAEPKDSEVYERLLKSWRFLRFSLPVDSLRSEREIRNPKRMQREIRRQLQGTGVGTKAQQALKLQREEEKLERKKRTRAQREAEEENRFTLRQVKRRKKHREH